MHIIVPIKQVPETSNVRMDPETGTMIRSGVEAIVNPLDLYAIEAALRLRDASGHTVTALSMGPPQAEKALREALAMGTDAAYLLRDETFENADLSRIARILSAAVLRLNPDLIITGRESGSDAAGQIGPRIAEILDMAHGIADAGFKQQQAD